MAAVSARWLVVDDNPADVHLLRLALEHEEGRPDIREARTVDQARELLERLCGDPAGWRPDLVLVDLRLPGRAGHELIAWIRATPALARLPVVVLSTSDCPVEVARAYRHGADCFLTKPADVEDTLALVRAVYRYWAPASPARPAQVPCGPADDAPGAPRREPAP